MEIKQCADERWTLVRSIDNSVKTEENCREREEEEEDEDDDDEALSFCDLPLIHQSIRKENGEYNTPLRANETNHQEDFDFCSLSKESEMCAADEVFYQGQILPLRHSLSSRKGFLPRSESVDHYFSGDSRSSSINSHHSSTSGSSTASADPRSPPRNIFHSHPSPSPKIHNKINNRKGTKKSSAWNVFRQGLIAAPPEIAIYDLKTRSSGKNLLNGSISIHDKRKNIKSWDLFGGCKCSVDAVDTGPSKVVMIKRSASDSVSQIQALQAEEESLLTTKSPKRRVSHRRMFEWLKQLSLEDTADER